MTPDKLRARAKYWQGVLGLQSWRIEVVVVPCRDMEDTNTLGICDPSRLKRCAYIKVLDEREFEGRGELCDDQETVLVHELLHVVFPHHLMGIKVDPDSASYAIYEQGIDATARALVALERGRG